MKAVWKGEAPIIGYCAKAWSPLGIAYRACNTVRANGVCAIGRPNFKNEGRDMEIRLLTGTMLVGLLSCVALAAPVTYPNPVTPPGATAYTDISEYSVTDPLPLYGSPSQIGNTLSFAPTAFASYSGPDSSDQTSGTLKFRASAPSGQCFNTLAISEVGDFAVTGLGNAQAYVSGLLTVRDLDSGAVLFDSLTVAPPSPFLHPPNNDGPFQADVLLQFPGNSTRNIEVVFNNTLATAAEPLSAALLQKKAIDFTITLQVPEPTTMLLLGVGAIGLLRQRVFHRRAA